MKHKPVFSICYLEGKEVFNASRRKREREERKRRKVKEGRRKGAGKEGRKKSTFTTERLSQDGLCWHLLSWRPSQRSIRPRPLTF